MDIFQHVANGNVRVLSKLRKSTDARHDVNSRSIETGQTPLMHHFRAVSESTKIFVISNI